jgi:hypothetical protein
MENNQTNKSNAPSPKDFECLGHTIHIEMDENGAYQESIDGVDINFAQWALQQKNKVNE